MKDIIVKHAKQGNLKDISVSIPRNKLVVLTGLSGSGKTTLALDVLYQECQRQHLEALGYQGINKPDVETILNVSTSIVITQGEKNTNPRSTLGTVTNIYADLRMIYEKIGIRTCPHCGKRINPAHCKEELEKHDHDFTVYMYCSECGKRMEKLTRSHFSFNTREGACPKCSGLGQVLEVNYDKLIDSSLSLSDGAIKCWPKQYKDYQLTLMKKIKTPIHFDKPYCELSKQEIDIVLNGNDEYEGVIKNLYRRMDGPTGQNQILSEYFHQEQCPDCHGEKLNAESRKITAHGKRISELTQISLQELYDWVVALKKEIGSQQASVFQYVNDLETKIRRIIKVGIGYLHLDRQTMTLSGGEKQRMKLAATLDSTLIGVIYILDEPTVGLHPQDTQGVIEILKQLRDRENTVIVIEHDEEVMKNADYIIDIGPGSGKHGGEVIAEGTYQEILDNPQSITGQYFRNQCILDHQPRTSQEYIELQDINIHNIHHMDIRFLKQCFNVVTGVSGAGKSSLVFGYLKDHYQDESFDQMICVKQSSITTMKRSLVVTYTGIYDEIRKIYASLPESKEKAIPVNYFSFNTKGGRCEHCEGLGTIVSNMLFFEDVEETCPTCGGKRFKPEILEIKYQGYSIHDILCLSIEEAIVVFKEHKKISHILDMLSDIGLSYLTLGQVLTTLSGGEQQRLKLAVELLKNKGKHNLYLIDEPTIGLHPLDVERLLVLFERIVEQGNTLIVIEHNLQIMKRADYIIDLGPGGGIDGGQVIAEGTPQEIAINPCSITGKYL
ncbi:MAG: excinuclease ABC subunit UvrA [Coprobacillus sp.]